MNNIPVINVGILFKPMVEFTLEGIYQSENGEELSGSWNAQIRGAALVLSNGEKEIKVLSGVVLSPINEECQFTLHGVTIGINFHWQRDEDQSFKGRLRLLIEDNKITAINILSVEDYLMSVISSEMSATSSLQLLKAHAVISRSWLLAQIEKNKALVQNTERYSSTYQTETELIRWYDREDHDHFDVCADDHCQRYQGITRVNTPMVVQAVKETWGEVLTYDGVICDARFSKCCGGMVEVFENVWEPVNHPYLQKVVDSEVDPKGFNLDLEKESSAEKWILGEPDVFCNTNDKEVLSQVLNDYDQETNDFYRWKVEYTQEEISLLVAKRTGIDFGIIQELIPVERGDSGRLIKLKIVGDKKTMIIGKELEIRKALSESHLYSSAFVVEKVEEGNQVKYILKGAGWGHGVGLCQIGAAVMGAKGYDYNSILMHYFRGAGLEKKYQSV